MAEKYSYGDAVKFTREASQKFDYFFLGVVLATLSLSFQQDTENVCFVGLLISSWILWLVSLAAGFIRQESFVSFLTVETMSMTHQSKHDILQQAKEGEQIVYKNAGEMWSTEDLQEELNDLGEILQSATSIKKKRSKQSYWFYHISKWSFWFGSALFVLFKILNI